MIFSRKPNLFSPIATNESNVYSVLAPISFHIKAMDTILISTGIKLCVQKCKTTYKRGHIAFYFNIEGNPYIQSSNKIDVLEFFERKELKITIINSSLQDYHVKAGTEIGKITIVEFDKQKVE